MEILFFNIRLTFNPRYFYLLLIFSFLLILFKRIRLAVALNLAFILYLFCRNFRSVMELYQCSINSSEYWCLVPYGIAVLLIGLFLFYFCDLFESTL